MGRRPPQAAPHVVHRLEKIKHHQSSPSRDHGDFTGSGDHGKFTMVHGWFRTVEMDMGDLYGFMGLIYHGPWLQDVTSGSELLMMANWVVSCKGESRSHRGFQC